MSNVELLSALDHTHTQVREPYLKIGCVVEHNLSQHANIASLLRERDRNIA